MLDLVFSPHNEAIPISAKLLFELKNIYAAVREDFRWIFHYYGQIDNDGNSPVVFQGK